MSTVTDVTERIHTDRVDEWDSKDILENADFESGCFKVKNVLYIILKVEKIMWKYLAVLENVRHGDCGAHIVTLLMLKILSLLDQS